MENKNTLLPPNQPDKNEAFIKSSLGIERISFEKAKEAIKEAESAVKPSASSPATERFTEKLESILVPNIPANELITIIVKTAVEVQLGKSFTLNPGFDKMVSKIVSVIMTDPLLRRQALSVVSLVLENKTETGKNIKND